MILAVLTLSAMSVLACAYLAKDERQRGYREGYKAGRISGHGDALRIQRMIRELEEQQPEDPRWN